MDRPTNLAELRESGWQSKTVKREIYDNLMQVLQQGDELFPGIVGYDDTVIPDIVLALLSEHDMLFLGEKGQAKSRIMRLLVRFLDPEIPYLDLPESPVHDDPYQPITSSGTQNLLANTPDHEVPIAWWSREDRYAERLAPGNQVCGRHWRNRSRQTGTWREHVSRKCPAFWLNSPHAPRHLCDERIAGTR